LRRAWEKATGFDHDHAGSAVEKSFGGSLFLCHARSISRELCMFNPSGHQSGYWMGFAKNIPTK
jgi:hypothetical protein